MSLLDKFRLDGQVAVITGAGKGIGASIARAFAEAGADVVIGARTEADLARVAQEVSALGRRALAVPTNVMEPVQLQQLVDRARAEFGRIDILVNNAGGFPPKPIAQTTVKEFEYAFRFNVSSAFELSRLCAPLMVETAGGGAILNISSIAGHKPAPWFSAYGTAKSALSMLTRELAQEFAPKVRVNAISVGGIATDALAVVLTNDELRAQFEANTPMGRAGTVEDIAACALYLASPAGGWVTGKIFQVDGGTEAPAIAVPAPKL